MKKDASFAVALVLLGFLALGVLIVTNAQEEIRLNDGTIVINNGENHAAIITFTSEEDFNKQAKELIELWKRQDKED